MHAPEPWTCVRIETPDYYVYEINSGSGHVASIAGWTHFATICPITDANAELICKAPAMLRVLKDLLEWAAFTGGWNAPCWEQATAIVTNLQAPPSSEDPKGAEP
jgi:hypothetical protein